MVVADYLRKKLIEPLEEKRRLEAERRREETEQRRQRVREEGVAEGRAEGRAESQAEWEAWNERRMAAEANGEPFDERPPGSAARDSE